MTLPTAYSSCGFDAVLSGSSGREGGLDCSLRQSLSGKYYLRKSRTLGDVAITSGHEVKRLGDDGLEERVRLVRI